MATVTKAMLCGRIAHDCGTAPAETARYVDELIRLIRDGVRHEGSVTLTNFGALEKREKRARPGRNIRTGDPLEIGPRNVAVFRVSRNFREELNGLSG